MNIRLWIYYVKNDGGPISISLKDHKSNWDLRQLTTKLKEKISAQDFASDKKDEIVKHLNTLLGKANPSKEWRYLNKGTHEESNREDFEYGTVKEIADALIALDSLV